MGEADLVHSLAPAGGSVLDLGCGTGRIAHPLIALGHPVVAVDAAPEMLAHVHGAETVHSAIADLHLGRTFDVVLMASHLVNTADDGDRRRLLAAAARHVGADGVLLAEQYPPSWFDEVADRAGGHIGEVGAELCDVSREKDVVAATIHYQLGDEIWSQTFTARRLDDEALHHELRGAGLSFERWCSDDRSWFVAARID
jgi:SAM-dependent methyltransferase